MTKDPGFDVIVIGGGISGLAAAVRLAERGRRVLVLEKKAHLGGRAVSFLDKTSGDEIDNCRHIVLGCCTNALDFFKTLGADGFLTFSKTFTYVSPDAARHTLRPNPLLPVPLNFLPSLLSFGPLSFFERTMVIGALLAMTAEDDRGLRRWRDRTMLDWLRAHHQPDGAIERFWRPILVSAINEDLERASALPALQVFLQGFLPHRDAPVMAVPRTGLSKLYAEPAAEYLKARGSAVRTRAKVDRILYSKNRAVGVLLADGEVIGADAVITAIPADALRDAAESGTAPAEIETSPITGVHLWWNAPVMDVPHAFLLDSRLHWVFRDEPGPDARARLGARERSECVVSASRALTALGQREIVEMAVAEIRRAFPAARSAECVHAVVVKEQRATFSITPEIERRRPPVRTAYENLFLAGDWTRTGWPSTLEGSVRSGRAAAAAALGDADPGLTADLPRAPLAALLLCRSPRRWPFSAVDHEEPASLPVGFP